MLFSLFTAPSATGTLASVGVWSSPTFDEFSDIIPIVVGSIVGALLVLFIINAMITAIYHLFGYRGTPWGEHKWRKGVREDEMRDKYN